MPHRSQTGRGAWSKADLATVDGALIMELQRFRKPPKPCVEVDLDPATVCAVRLLNAQPLSTLDMQLRGHAEIDDDVVRLDPMHSTATEHANDAERIAAHRPRRALVSRRRRRGEPGARG